MIGSDEIRPPQPSRLLLLRLRRLLEGIVAVDRARTALAELEVESRTTPHHQSARARTMRSWRGRMQIGVSASCLRQRNIRDLSPQRYASRARWHRGFD